MRPVVEQEFFDHRAAPQLEQYLQEQVATQTYDFAANKALLKLYQFFPELTHADPVALCLGKALMALPAAHFTALLYIAPERCLHSEPVQSLKKAFDALETAQYPTFWGLVQDPALTPLVAQLPGFAEQAQRIILNALASTFQALPQQQLASSLGLSSAEELQQFAAQQQQRSVISSLQGSTAVFAPNASNQIQPKKFKESIEFEKVLRVINRN